MNENKRDLLDVNYKENNKNFISKKLLRTSYHEKNENAIKFIIKKPLLFKVENNFNLTKNKKLNGGRWTNEEHDKFLNGLQLYGTIWKKFKNLIKTRTLLQVRSHAQKFYLKMKLCKNEDLGINFTSDSISNLNDMINQIKSVNNNYNIVNIFKYLNNEFNNSQGKFKKKSIDANLKNLYIHEEANKLNFEVENIKNDNINNFEKNIFDYVKTNFFLDNLNYDEELSSDQEISIPKQFLQKMNSMIL